MKKTAKVINKKVFMGMSGGVDSSVSAALLKEQGFDVTGVFIKTWSPDWLPCTWQEERRDAMRVAAKLKIPLITLDLEKEYKEEVVDYMIAEYRAGRVPNPDVMCNKVIKFGGFFDFAMKHGADFVATGHYAQLRPEVTFSAHGHGGEFAPKATSGLCSARTSKVPREQALAGSPGLVSEGAGDPRVQIVDARRRRQTIGWSSGNFVEPSLLCTSADREKDQTYFLWTLTQRELSKTLFPVGHLQKSEVRRLAKKFGLPNAEKKDSQGLCFMGKIDVKDFLKHYIKEKPGKVLNESGELIGEHEGVTFYTLGERHGFKVFKKGTNDTPYYIVGKNIKKNTLTVSNKKDDGEILKKEIEINNVNWNQGALPDLSKIYQARIRYRQELQKCRITKAKSDSYKLIFENGQMAPAPGQSVVVYSDRVCLGGGVIV